MKRPATVSVLCCLLAFLAIDAYAWELKLRGMTEVRYRYLTRLGDDDLFGDVTSHGGTPLGVNHLKEWPSPHSWQSPTVGEVGIVTGEPHFGADMDQVDMRATFYPTLQVNKAIRLSGSINLTSLGQHTQGKPFGPWYTYGSPGLFNSLWIPINNPLAATNVPNMLVTAQWWKLSLMLPMLELNIGSKPFPWGIGLWKGECQRAETNFSMTTRYGPFTLGFHPYLGRNERDWSYTDYREGTGPAPYRKQNIYDYFRGLSFSLTYQNGPFEMGVMHEGYTRDAYHGVVFRDDSGAPNEDTESNGRNRWSHDTIYYLKYFNGSFFLNAELDHFWQYECGRLKWWDDDENAFMYGVELGGIAGPLKITASYFRATGDDISTRETNEDAGTSGGGISSCYVRNWAYLMEYRYGTGSGFNAAGEGSPTNVHHVGVRADYALAANLNVYALGVGCWRDAAQTFRWGGDGLYRVRIYDNFELAYYADALRRPVPATNDSIGWEVDTGFQWRLLENLTWSMTAAFWKPGEWWGFALPNSVAIFTNSNQSFPIYGRSTNFALAMANPTRNIDPLFALESTLSVDF